ncbi:MAG: hypothetical protein HZB16_06675 [Armatimonadetes bacterium]|nr:hypothetical protein [Armatimonadota bacterium]
MTNLHRTLQDLYAGDDGQTEIIVDGFRVDVVRDGVIYEIQTGRFRALRDKVDVLSQRWPVVIVHPVAAEKLLVKVDTETGEVLSERRSPKRGSALNVFLELPSIAPLLARENVRLEVLLCRQRELRDAQGRPHRWRNRVGVKMLDRQLLEVLDRRVVGEPADLLALLPAELPDPFTVPDLRETLGVNVDLARKIAYGLAKSGVTVMTGRRGRCALYGRAEAG